MEVGREGSAQEWEWEGGGGRRACLTASRQARSLAISASRIFLLRWYASDSAACLLAAAFSFSALYALRARVAGAQHIKHERTLPTSKGPPGTSVPRGSRRQKVPMPAALHIALHPRRG